MKAIEFFQEVKQEALRIAWPSRRETITACGLVLFLATLAGLFFLLVDSIIFKIIQLILGI